MEPATARCEDFLESLPLFSDLTSPEIAQVATRGRLVTSRPGERLITEGQPVRTLYFVIAGEAAVVKEDVPGKPVALATVGKGAVLGEMSLLDNAPAFATIVVTEPLQSVAIAHADFTDLIDQHPRIGCKVFRKIAKTTSLRLKLACGQLVEYVAAVPDQTIRPA